VFCFLRQVHPEGKYVVDLDKNIDINDITPNCRVALRSDSYTLHKILPNKVTASVCVCACMGNNCTLIYCLQLVGQCSPLAKSKGLQYPKR